MRRRLKNTTENLSLLKVEVAKERILDINPNCVVNMYQTFYTPKTENEITFKLLTGRDDEMVKREIEGLKKIDKNSSAEVSTRLKYMITSVNGLTDSKSIREFVDNNLIAIESKALRDYVKEIQPNVNMMIHLDDMDNEIELPITLSFFWPD